MTPNQKIDWLCAQVIKMCKAAHAHTDQSITTERGTAERETLQLASDIVDITYNQCMEVIDNV